MSGETERQVSGWTIDTLKYHHEALRRADEKFENERDRRLAEVAIEREKALKIKETADLAALSLAREIQTHKDEKANNLRSQIEGERGLYATRSDLKGAVEKIEATMKPIAEYISRQQGQIHGVDRTTTVVVGAFGLLLTLISIASIIYGVTR